MNTTTRQSIQALFSGFLFVIVVSIVIDVVLRAAKVLPPLDDPMDDRSSLVATSYRFIIGIAAGYLTARLAPANPMKHAMILGIIGTVLGTLGVVASWGSKLGPAWYPIAVAALAIPQCWIGVQFYRMGKNG